MKPVTERGVGLAEGDLAMAAYARRRTMFEPCVYHCHQALEKMLKAIWEERESTGSPPKTHNLASLARELFPDMDDSKQAFLQRLARQYLPSRYPEYDPDYSKSEVAGYYKQTREIFVWLRHQLT